MLPWFREAFSRFIKERKINNEKKKSNKINSTKYVAIKRLYTLTDRFLSLVTLKGTETAAFLTCSGEKQT